MRTSENPGKNPGLTACLPAGRLGGGHPEPPGMNGPFIDLRQLRVRPLAERKSLTRVEDILIEPDAPPPGCTSHQADAVRQCAQRLQAARHAKAAVLLMYGAHLLRNGAARLLERMMARGWLTHLATNGAGSIHDWEYAFLGRSTESVEENVATGTFGTWDETGRMLQLALLAGGVRAPVPGEPAFADGGEGYGRALGRFICEDGTTLPSSEELTALLRAAPDHPLAAARADLLQAMRRHGLPPGRHRVEHRWKHASILAQAFRHGVPLTVHPGIGYDIITNHPLFNGAVVGRAAQWDFQFLGGSVNQLDGGLVLSVGSAIMAPQVFEKCLSCVNNLRLQAGQSIVQGHTIQVVDLQDGGHWDWSQGEPPKTNPAYYLRFCKSFSRMGGTMNYLQCDNVTFLHHLYLELNRLEQG